MSSEEKKINMSDITVHVYAGQLLVPVWEKKADACIWVHAIHESKNKCRLFLPETWGDTVGPACRFPYPTGTEYHRCIMQGDPVFELKTIQKMDGARTFNESPTFLQIVEGLSTE